MTAWQKLTQNSSLPTGTAWQHLNAQTGGSGSVIYESHRVNLSTIPLNIEISTIDIDVKVTRMRSEINDNPLAIELKDGVMTSV